VVAASGVELWPGLVRTSALGGPPPIPRSVCTRDHVSVMPRITIMKYFTWTLIIGLLLMAAFMAGQDYQLRKLLERQMLVSHGWSTH
jgi:hypothetical protein